VNLGIDVNLDEARKGKEKEKWKGKGKGRNVIATIQGVVG
jgi:hypothetical protein